jgi:hypothetical protein
VFAIREIDNEREKRAQETAWMELAHMFTLDFEYLRIRETL